MRGKVLSFGELLLRITPDGETAPMKENTLSFFIGGAEANVATALALWNIPSAYLTALPDNYISKQNVKYLQHLKVDTSKILYQGDRLGLYYLSRGKDLNNGGVIYDREHSSFATIEPKRINWDSVFEGVAWFHFSAICPAINQNIADVCLEGLREAGQKNIIVSLDLNYREKLWQYKKLPTEIMPELAKYCQLIMGNIWAANTMLDINLDKNLIEPRNKGHLLKHALDTSQAIIRHFPKCTTVANTFRFDHETGIQYFTTLYSDNKLHVSHEYSAEHITNKVGSGDCYMAGLIYGFYNDLTTPEIVDFATAAAFNKLFIYGDATTCTIEDIKKTMKFKAGEFKTSAF